MSNSTRADLKDVRSELRNMVGMMKFLRSRYPVGLDAELSTAMVEAQGGIDKCLLIMARKLE